MNFKNAISESATPEHVEKLYKVYKKVPSGQCKGCTNCCSESVNVSFLEFANIVTHGVNRLSELEQQELNKRVLSFYLLQWVKPQRCPFLDRENQCLIYDVRPLPCRLFGTLKKKDYEANYKQIEQQNIFVASGIYQEFQLKLPVRVVRRKIDFCEDFIPDKTLTTAKVDLLYSELVNLDGRLFFQGLIEETWLNGDLINWYIDYLVADHHIINKDMLREMRLACLKSIQK